MFRLILCLSLLILLASHKNLDLDDHWQDAKVTEANSTVVLIGGGFNLNGESLEIDDEVAALTFQDTVAGRIHIGNPSISHSFPIWKDESFTPDTLDGYQINEPIRLYLWDDSEGIEYSNGLLNFVQDTSCSLCAKDLFYQTNLVYVFNQVDWDPPLSINPDDPMQVNLEIQLDFDVFPNPFGEIVHMTATAPKAYEAEFGIYDITGRRIWGKTITITPLGGTVQADLPTIASGIYIAMVKTHYRTVTKVIVKQ